MVELTFPPSLTLTEARQSRRLRSMKRLAGSVLLAAAALFVVASVVPDNTAIGFLRAAAEAAMVGGLADWFAITALFRRPLGLPIPHTALIPTRKDQLAESLGEFVTTTFLTRDNVGERLSETDIVSKTANWLADPHNAHRIAEELAAAADNLADALSPVDLADVLLAAARTDAATRAYAPLLGRLLQTTVEDDAHQAMTDIVLGSMHRWLVENRYDVVPQLKARIEEGGLLLQLFTTTARVDRLVVGATAYLHEASMDRHHDLRRLIDRLLLVLAHDLQAKTEMAAQVNVEAMRVLRDPALRDWLIEVVHGVRESLRVTLADPAGPAVGRIADAVVDHAQRVGTDPHLHDRYDELLRRVVFHVIDRYADEFTQLVATTVARWDGAETARRMELLAGRDLQFIRINGSVVGGLAGVAIHAIGLAL